MANIFAKINWNSPKFDFLRPTPPMLLKIRLVLYIVDEPQPSRAPNTPSVRWYKTIVLLGLRGKLAKLNIYPG
jgi:hypothetical protein